MSRCNREHGCRLSFEHVGRCDPSPLRRDLRTVELPADAKVGEVFVVMIDASGEAHVQRSTDTGAVLDSATVPTARLLADLLTYADRNVAALVESGGAGNNAATLVTDDVRKMLHAFARNIAQGLVGRVLP